MERWIALSFYGKKSAEFVRIVAFMVLKTDLPNIQ